MDINALITARQSALDRLVARREALGDEGQGILDAVTARGEDATLTEQENQRHLEIVEERAALVPEIEAARRALELVQREAEDEERQTQLTEVRTPAAEVRATVVRVSSEPRTYTRENDPKGRMFLRDVALSAIGGNVGANERLARHMQEEHVEREAAGRPLIERAVGSSAFTGLVVPQYLVDQFAPLARAGRPFADAARHHDLPEQGMTVYLSKLTTGTSADEQATEGATVDETDADDTQLSISVKTVAGSQSVSRQAVERGAGVDDTLAEDLVRAFHTKLDSKLLNATTTGLTNVATSITYTDADPTAAELYPKLLAGPAAVEAALLDQGIGDTFMVCHSRRWYWMQSQLTSTWPMFGQPGVPAQLGGVNYGERYGAGFRGVLPSGTPVIVDNNIATNLGAGTNEDEIYFVAQSEAHLWEDPNAPLLIRAEQSQAKKLLIDLVVYGYYAYTFTRRSHAQKIAGTGLVTPSF